MCLAIPAQIIQLLPNQQAHVSVGGVKQTISLSLLAEPGAIDDYVIIHVGFALSKLNKARAEQTLADFATMLRDST